MMEVHASPLLKYKVYTSVFTAARQVIVNSIQQLLQRLHFLISLTDGNILRVLWKDHKKCK